MTKPKVLICYGGASTEHEVSRRSAAFILDNIDTDRYDVELVGITLDGEWRQLPCNELRGKGLKELPRPEDYPTLLSAGAKELALPSSATLLQTSTDKSPQGESEMILFPIVHGTSGEDGSIQGFMEMAGKAYVGPDVYGAALSMDKIHAKNVMIASGIETADFCWLANTTWQRSSDEFLKTVEEKLNLPIFVKPARLGSSVGISKVTDIKQLRGAIEEAFRYDFRVLCEQGLEAREIECAVLGDEEPEVSIPGEVIPKKDFYTYEAKYLDDEGADLAIPAVLSTQEQDRARSMCRKAFQVLGLYGMARVDLFYVEKENRWLFNEANTIPGFTEISQYPLLWKHSGINGKELLTRLVELARTRHKRTTSLKRQL